MSCFENTIDVGWSFGVVNCDHRDDGTQHTIPGVRLKLLKWGWWPFKYYFPR